MKQPAVIFDIDGTLSDPEHRRHLVTGEKKDWPTFLGLCGKDPLKENVAQLARWVWSFHPGDVLLVSGRGVEYKNLTAEWLASHNVNYDLLLMRPPGDSRPDTEIKMEIYKRDIEPHYDVKLVVEDRTRLVKMWRSLGLECWQVAEGDF